MPLQDIASFGLLCLELHVLAAGYKLFTTFGIDVVIDRFRLEQPDSVVERWLPAGNRLVLVDPDGKLWGDDAG